MKSASPALIALLAKGDFLIADLFTFRLRSGLVLRYTTSDIDLELDGAVFSARGAIIDGGLTTLEFGLAVSTTEVTITPKDWETVHGVPMLKAIRQGVFDRAEFIRQQVFMPEWGDTSAGAIMMFVGEVSDRDPSGTSVRLTVKSKTYLLNKQMPPRLYQPACPWVFGGAACGVDKAAYAVPGSALAGSAAQKVVTALGQAAGYFDGGTVQMTSGANAGLARTVRSHAAGLLTLVAPFPNPVAAGDGFVVAPGCNKTLPQLVLGSLSASIPAVANPAVQIPLSAGFATDLGVALMGLTSHVPGYWTWDFSPLSRGEGAVQVWIEGYAVKDPDMPMTRVTGVPAAGQYAVTAAGLYSFAAANAGRGVAISYQAAVNGAQSPCFARYRNTGRFGGAPFVPVPETAI